ncbi:uncharacterized protein LOC142819594 [Pelodiscus sinensis]|uniref:uncharacterized protein LOC142819594 n=1 Tax=Pelodiscus sinensis TaxID=13735 RepID=UPI003F6BCE0F
MDVGQEPPAGNAPSPGPGPAGARRKGGGGEIMIVLASPSASCHQCKSRGGGGCSGVSQPCVSVKGACLSVWEANTLVKERTENTGTFYSCIPSGVSARNISLFFGTGLYLHVQSQVCTADGCNSDIQPTWPVINTVYTGGRCPACFAPGRDSCSSAETLQCEGRASQCISISGRISEDDVIIPFAAKGCATPHACKLEKGVTLDSGVFSYEIAQVECYTPSGAEPTRGPLVLASLAGLLAVKVLS